MKKGNEDYRLLGHDAHSSEVTEEYDVFVIRVR